MPKTTLCRRLGIDYPIFSVGMLQRGSKSVDVPRYWALCATADFDGDLEYAALHAGESCGLVNDIKPAAEIVQSLMTEASHVVARLHEM